MIDALGPHRHGPLDAKLGINAIDLIRRGVAATVGSTNNVFACVEKMLRR